MKHLTRMYDVGWKELLSNPQVKPTSGASVKRSGDLYIQAGAGDTLFRAVNLFASVNLKITVEVVAGGHTQLAVIRNLSRTERFPIHDFGFWRHGEHWKRPGRESGSCELHRSTGI
jgi:hypothetical protein